MFKRFFCAAAILATLFSTALAEASFGQFTTSDIYGNQVTEAIFSDYDVTMVNVWATWGEYCVNEMPDLCSVYNRLPDNANLITICYDAMEEPALALEILGGCGAPFDTLLSSDSLQENLLYRVYTFPTTLFVDACGNVIGNVIEGIPAGNVADSYYAALMRCMD